MLKDEHVYYVDGACTVSEKVGAWAVVQLLPYEDEAGYTGIRTLSFSGSKKEATGNEMELTAAFMAITKAYKEGAKQVTIFTDSAYLANSITKNWLLNWFKSGWKTKEGNPVKNQEIWKKLYKLVYCKEIVVRIVQVRAHIGDPLNELADTIAVEAKNK
uniref:ribonuclease H n=1 Tax=Dulem virus 36 TaxID=3145754 RepID=A0AAU8AYI1_9CAUD